MKYTVTFICTLNHRRALLRQRGSRVELLHLHKCDSDFYYWMCDKSTYCRESRLSKQSDFESWEIRSSLEEVIHIHAQNGSNIQVGDVCSGNANHVLVWSDGKRDLNLDLAPPWHQTQEEPCWDLISSCLFWHTFSPHQLFIHLLSKLGNRGFQPHMARYFQFNKIIYTVV